MFLTHSQQALAVAVLRIAPLVTSTTSATFAYLSHAYVAGFKHREVSYEARSAVIPGWWDHIRPLSLVIIWGSFIPSFIFGLLNAYNATLGGLLGDGTRGMVGPLAGKLYLIGGWVSIAYFGQTVIRQFVPLQLNVLMVAKEPAAKREAALDKFLRMDYVRGWTTGFPTCALMLAATTAWVADQL